MHVFHLLCVEVYHSKTVLLVIHYVIREANHLSTLTTEEIWITNYY